MAVHLDAKLFHTFPTCNKKKSQTYSNLEKNTQNVYRFLNIRNIILDIKPSTAIAKKNLEINWKT